MVGQLDLAPGGWGRMDGDLKIQLEDVEDLKFLRQEFSKYLQSNALTTTDLQRQRVLATGALLRVISRGRR